MQRVVPQIVVGETLLQLALGRCAGSSLRRSVVPSEHN